MRAKWSCVFFICLFLPPLARTAVPQEWESAGTAYRRGDYTSAVKLYEELVKEGYAEPALFFNLGKSYFKLGYKGRAILSLERALLLDPSSETIQTFLYAVRETLADQIQPGEKSPVDLWLLDVGAGTWATKAIFLFWISMIIWFAGRFRTGLLWGKSKHVALSITMTGALLLGISLYTDYRANDWRQAVLLSREAPILLAPDSKSPVLRSIHEGTKLRILEYLNGWVKIRLENGDEGWMLKEGIAQIAHSGESGN